MATFMNRSIDLMERLAQESGNSFHLNRRGYLYVTAEETAVPLLIERSRHISHIGDGRLREHRAIDAPYQTSKADGFTDQPDGADLLLSPNLIRKKYPYLTTDAVAALHVRRAGWLSAQQLGMYMFESARRSGVHFENDRVDGVGIKNGYVSSVHLSSGESISTPIFINASGPYLKEIGLLLSEDLPVFTELHMKAAIPDSLAVVDRDAPLLIWMDRQKLPWNSEERKSLEASGDTQWLLQTFPSGVHTRPEGPSDSQTILMLWEYKATRIEPIWPPPLDALYSEVALRGLSTMLPRMKQYFNKLPKPQLDGGYYTRTLENRPLIGRTNVNGSFMIGAVSGYGIMSACAAGDLLASSVTDAELPEYAAAFRLDRYADPNYLEEIKKWEDTGQL
jgi:glycine/D-amino acid oxidase-like deaminating enzyme